MVGNLAVIKNDLVHAVSCA